MGTTRTKKKNREIANFCIAQELGGLELLEASYEKQNFSCHSHEGYTIGVIETGAQRFYRSGGNHVAPSESIILVNADELHNGHSATEGGWSYQAMYPLPEHFEQIGRSFCGAPYFPAPVVYDPELASRFRQLFSVLKSDSTRLYRETALYEALMKLVIRHGKNEPNMSDMASAKRNIQRAKEFLDDLPQADVSLEELASIASLSPYHFAREFKKTYGIPPHAYQVQVRLRLAKKWMLSGMKIMDVAHDLGFHDQSHFHRHFKSAMGITPSQFAKAA
ncbi:putative Cupin domain fused with AraC-type DNA-binding domain-containing protein [Vibrio nigripulchritudo SFn27]|uniref:Putative Cupin domain fused with AraC-type DNA-binding domain-containing protein n=1 Tax=Vibrio nigripulchritudo TaxID=28173 RepID=U4KH82_9VIBR|nr:AraC family transcriptional regulator [Vibrio nigripulchritudo]CCN80950.1 putative Cupin domain fused with AraC-type DNA-binding domain-containing protein [Vibrio nigripulchritudo BLFn1]CCN89179.1 putative Cupin domain fused with AraC-type DNA-binding domain-containing protein [Vibrio nigripulchritudo SFn27]CCN96636.1 putative Cupin domain fused with AraC-type DNA-binding domain-containing protein [Vibrio nigripulchritudo ENn2]CCO39594.1 putative Cupin domain fused with AraC-type DNA-binding